VPYLKTGGRALRHQLPLAGGSIVKNVFASLVAQGKCVYPGRGNVRSAVVAGDGEVARNPRSRSAKLRVVEKR